MEPENAEEELCRSVIHLEADCGSSLFDVHIENCDATQLLGMAELLHAQGMMALAAQQAQSQAESKRQTRNSKRLIVPRSN